MRLDAALTALLKPLFGNRVWWDTLPEAYVVDQPVLILEQISGDAFWNVDNTLPSHANARIQVTVWAKTRSAANTAIMQVEEAIAASGMVAQPVGAFSGMYETDLNLYGNRQHFSFWHTRT